MKIKDPCKVHACAIQKCLKENDFQEDKCKQFIEYLRQCCVKWGAESTSCSGINIDQVYSNDEQRKSTTA